MWQFTGTQRPDFAESTTPGQESVWDYPRPPALRNDARLVEVRSGELVLATSDHCVRICETASPPTFYLPPDRVDMTQLEPAPGQSYCEWKGAATYWRLRGQSEVIGWSYPAPQSAFGQLRDWVSFYPGRIECYVDGERVKPQPGGFYGGWITSEIIGPFKGEPGTGGW